MSLGDADVAAIDRHIKALEQRLQRLPAAARREALLELRSHLLESALQHGGADRVAQAIAAFGPVDAYADAVVADWLLQHGSRGFHPLSLAEGLARNAGLGLLQAAIGGAFAVAYLALAMMAFASIAKLVSPAFGLWLHSDGDWSLGWVEDDATELLGWWLVPLGLAIVAAGWWGLNRGLRWALRRMRRDDHP